MPAANQTIYVRETTDKAIVTMRGVKSNDTPNSMPVSYTHLDVYKRQRLRLLTCLDVRVF